MRCAFIVLYGGYKCVYTPDFHAVNIIIIHYFDFLFKHILKINSQTYLQFFMHFYAKCLVSHA